MNQGEFRRFLALKVSWDCWKTSCGAHRFNHTNPQALCSCFDCCLCPCCYRNRLHCQKWKDDNPRGGGGGSKKKRQKKKAGNAAKDNFKSTLSAFWYYIPFYKRDSQKLSTEVETMPHISGEIRFKQHFPSTILLGFVVSTWGKQNAFQQNSF